MIELGAGEGYNEGPELRLLVQADKILDVPRIMETFTDTQREVFAHYRRQPSDYRPILGHHDGFRFNCEWTFPKEVA